MLSAAKNLLKKIFVRRWISKIQEGEDITATCIGYTFQKYNGSHAWTISILWGWLRLDIVFRVEDYRSVRKGISFSFGSFNSLFQTKVDIRIPLSLKKSTSWLKRVKR